MSHPKKPISRRDLLKGLAAATVVSGVPAVLRGNVTTPSLATEDGSTTRNATTATPPAHAGPLHRVLCANILLASPAYAGKPGEWKNRRDLCFKIFRNHNPDLIGMQEVLKPQALDLADAFDDYQHFGFAGPFMDQHPEGYHGVTKNVVMFRKARYQMVDSGSFWLSETPLIAGSVSWDAMRGRHVNWVRLLDKESKQEFRLVNTHFDHKGQVARENQARMINEESAQYAKHFPQILCGDFNADSSNPAVKTLVAAGWQDTYQAVHGDKDSGRTFHGLKGPAHVTKSKNGRIDFIFTRGAITPKAAEVITDHDGDLYPSDHYFMMADLQIG